METKGAYPIILRPTDNGYYVDIPDFDVGTQGQTIAEAMEMARDVIGLMGLILKMIKKNFQSHIQRALKQRKKIS